jgi:hypothetical protein
MLRRSSSGARTRFLFAGCRSPCSPHSRPPPLSFLGCHNQKRLLPASRPHALLLQPGQVRRPGSPHLNRDPLAAGGRALASLPPCPPCRVEGQTGAPPPAGSPPEPPLGLHLGCRRRPFAASVAPREQPWSALTAASPGACPRNLHDCSTLQ